MSATEILVQAETRPVGTKGGLTRLRANGQIPAVIYGDGKPAETVALNSHAFTLMLQHHSGENMMMDIEVAGSTPRHVLLKQVQHHPISKKILHVDFHEISMDRKVKVSLPLNLVGTPVGVSKSGGTLDTQLREIEIECKASELIEELDVDVSELAIGDNLTVDSVTLPAGFRLITPGHVSIAAVLKPRVAAAGEDDAATDSPSQPEVITAAAEAEGDED